MKRSALLLVLAVLATACSMSAASEQLPTVRLNYNEAIARSNNEQLLLNIVRLRYLHAPQFFEVSSVTSQSALVRGGNASLVGNAGNNIANESIFTPFVTATIGGSVVMEDRPTVQYSPLQGEEFAQRMVSPIRADVLLLMVEVGWRFDRLLMTCVQRINDLNAPIISSADEGYGASEFRRLAQLLYQLQTYQLLEVTVAGRSDDRRLVLTMLNSPDPQLQASVDEVKRLLGLDPNLTSYRVAGSHVVDEQTFGPDAPVAPTATEDASGDRIILRGRSLLGALFYLSHGVEVSASDATARSLDYTSTRGEPIQVPKEVPGALLRIEASEEMPQGAFVATRYRGRFYSVSDRDLDSKANLLLLSVLFSVLSSSNSGAPVLTIPVGG